MTDCPRDPYTRKNQPRLLHLVQNEKGARRESREKRVVYVRARVSTAAAAAAADDKK